VFSNKIDTFSDNQLSVCLATAAIASEAVTSSPTHTC